MKQSDVIEFKNFEIIDDLSKINESVKSEVANSKGSILAIVRGKHFVPGGTSRNNRYYPKEVWEHVKNDEEFMTRLKNNDVIGRIGHDAELTDEEIGKGNFSHYTRNIDFDTGIAESVIVNTPMGNTLLTMLQSGMTMYVSSRADGDFNGKNEDGNDILDPDSFKLERFDFVRDPGFLEASPKLVTESLDKDKDNDKVDNSKVELVKSLLNILWQSDTPLVEDDIEYTIEDISDDGVKMIAKGDLSPETYSFEELSEKVDDIEKMIAEKLTNLESVNKNLNESLSISRFANDNGLNSEYVSEKISEGYSKEEIIRMSDDICNPRYSIKSVNESYEDDDSNDSGINVTFLNSLFNNN